MEISPRELRDVEIAEAWRGYHRDVVNDLLERAAATIEAANQRVRELSERLSALQAEAGRGRETEDILHRTLLLAQRAADEAVAEAQQRARQMVEEAEIQSRKMLAEAEADARRRGETERRRLEEEVLDLAARRDALLGDVEALTRFENEYRDRLARALEADLAALRQRPSAAPGPQPEPHEVELPGAERRETPAAGPAPAAEGPGGGGPPTRPVPAAALFDQSAEPARAEAAPPAPPRPFTTAPPAAGTAPGPSAGADTPAAAGTPAAERPGEPRPAYASEPPVGERPGEPGAGGPRPGEPQGIDLLGEGDAVEAEVLDDDAFFATLREAVHDDAPLGPRDDQEDEQRLDFLDDDRSSFRDVFRRRR
ncbi:MAG: hypothetical protein KatS3mg009_2522 [Acidimicrobiia bacterium]|nr:MAG: hypothetical protein KatS3mg009_2522 [Acidimicrobiia bacterium]